jgi:hypothetical protein
VNLDPRSPVNRVLTAALATRRGGRVDATPYRQAGHRGKLKLSRLRQRIADAYAAELGVARNLLLREPLPDEQLADVRQLDRLRAIFDERSNPAQNVVASVGG